MKSSAVIDGPYRYELSREWDESSQRLRFCMLNPSTADALKDDPTIRRCIGFAKKFGYGGIVVVNLYAWRCTKPLKHWEYKHIGPKNNDYIERLCFERDVICAWGANAYGDRVEEVMDIFKNNGIETYHLGLTKGGFPKHPLYLPLNSQMQEYKLEKC